MISTRNGKAIKFNEVDLRYIGRTAMGVRGIRLKGDDATRNIIAANDDGSILTVTENGYGKITEVSKYREQGRGGSGVINIKANQKTGKVANCMYLKGDQKVVLISSQGISITFPTNEVRITGRAASGVRLMHLPQGVRVVGAALVSAEPQA